jgi:hypothetical protein
MAVDIIIQGLTVAQKTALMAKLLTFYGPKPEGSTLTDKQWVTLCLWREIKNRIKSVVSREKDAELRAAQDAVDADLGDEVV